MGDPRRVAEQLAEDAAIERHLDNLEARRWERDQEEEQRVREERRALEARRSRERDRDA